MIELEQGRFKKYESILLTQFKEAEIDGECLKDFDPSFLKMYGIKNFKDQKDLMKHIKQLSNMSILNDMSNAIPYNDGNITFINNNIDVYDDEKEPGSNDNIIINNDINNEINNNENNVNKLKPMIFGFDNTPQEIERLISNNQDQEGI